MAKKRHTTWFLQDMLISLIASHVFLLKAQTYHHEQIRTEYRIFPHKMGSAPYQRLTILPGREKNMDPPPAYTKPNSRLFCTRQSRAARELYSYRLGSQNNEDGLYYCARDLSPLTVDLRHPIPSGKMQSKTESWPACNALIELYSYPTAFRWYKTCLAAYQTAIKQYTFIPQKK